MSKFNTGRVKAAGTSPVVSQSVASGVTFEGAPGYTRDVKGELFLLAVTNMGGEDTFYESARDRDSRYAQLVAAAAIADPVWTAGLLEWLRSEANMRTASIVGAIEAARAMLAAKIPGARQIVSSVMQRGDEPGEAIAYWLTRYGRAIPKPIKRGIADAAARLYIEYTALKYDTPSHSVRFGDVLDMTHPAPSAAMTGQGVLFKHLLDRRHGRPTGIPSSLTMMHSQAKLRELVARGEWGWLLDPVVLGEAGMTWEDALSLAGDKVDKAKLWAALIPGMGYMALLRNLRNFDAAGVPDSIAEQVAERLADPQRVARSRQFPYRFLAAYEQAPSLRWGHALDKALQASVGNLPVLPGRSLVLIDTSASMTSQALSGKSTMTAAKAAAVFGVALAARNGADLYGFANGQFSHPIRAGASVIEEIKRFCGRTGEVGHGTEMFSAIQATYRGHHRIFVLTDMQTVAAAPGQMLDQVLGGRRDVAVYGFNLAGYRHGAIPNTGSANRHEFGGLTDATFRMVPLIEAGQRAAWPWES